MEPKMRKKISRIAVGIIMGLCLVAIVMLVTRIVNQKEIPKEFPKIEVNDKTEAILTKWVYEHSKQISRKTCKEIVEECLKTGKPLLLLAVIEQESEFVPTAVSKKGALGLTQVRATTEFGKDVHEKDLIAKGIIKEKRDLFDVGPSVMAGDYILTLSLKDAKGDVSKALEAYLGGQDGWYVKRILSTLANLYILVETGGKYSVTAEKEKPMPVPPKVEKPKPAPAKPAPAKPAPAKPTEAIE